MKNTLPAKSATGRRNRTTEKLYRQFQRENDPLLDPTMAALLDEKDIADYRSWLKILQWLKRRRPDVERERRRLIAENDVATADRLAELMAEISSVFSGSPGPHGKLSAILKEIDRLLDRNAGAIDIDAIAKAG